MTLLCYHAVEPGWPSPLAVDPTRFAVQCAHLARRRTVLPLDVAVTRLRRGWTLPHGATALTFDDGFASVYEQALPVLARHGLPATVFVVAETLSPSGRPVDWVDTPPAYPMRTLTGEQLRELDEAGVRVESHSYSHHDLTQLSEHECTQDLLRSRELLEDLLGRPVRHLAYPRGRHAPHVRRAAERAGYSHAFSLPESAEHAGQYAVPRVGVFDWNSARTVALKATRPYLRLRTGRAFPVVRRTVRRLKPAGMPG